MVGHPLEVRQSSALGARVGPKVSAVHTGFAPIATCHWQSLAKIVATYGLPDIARSLCLTWGARRHGASVLAAGGRWPRLLADLYKLTVEQYAWPSATESERFESALARAGIPFVAEIDAFHVPSPYQGREHVVHTVIVTGLDEHAATVVDTTNNPVAVRVALSAYRLMRESDCVGRLEPRKLYIARPVVEPKQPDAGDVFAAVHADIVRDGPGDLRCIEEYREWLATSEEPADVPRVAGERYAAAQGLRYLAEAGLTALNPIAETLRQLSDDWYLVHMISVHQRGREARQRARVLRLLADLARRERALHDELHELAP